MIRRISTPILLLASLLAVACSAGALTQLTAPSRYTATAQVVAAPRSVHAPSAEIIRILAATYVAYGSSGALAADVARATGVPAGQTERAISLSMPSTSTTIRVDATTTSRGQSRAIADGVMKRLVARSAADQTLKLTVVNAAAPDGPDTTMRRSVMAATILLAAVLVLAFSLWEIIRRSRHRTSGGTP